MKPTKKAVPGTGNGRKMTPGPAAQASETAKKRVAANMAKKAARQVSAKRNAVRKTGGKK